MSFSGSIETYPPGWLHSFSNDEKDRHVLAVAVRSKSEVIVTFNLRHFQAKDLEPWDVKAKHPQEFLLSLYDLNRGTVHGHLFKIAEQRRKDLSQVLGNLRKTVPAFALEVADDLNVSL